VSARLLTTEEVAARLHRSEPSVRRLCFDGKLRATKDGRQWLVLEEDLDEYVNSKSNRPRRRRNRAA
jgi:excisionase family DNA binding protein